jgi:hypothetical protein
MANMKIKSLPKNAYIPRPKDINNEVEEKGCNIQGVASYNDQRELVLLDWSLFSKMSPTHQAALWFHEAIYKVLRDDAGASNSVRAREIVGYLFSNAQYSIPSENFKSDDDHYFCKAPEEDIKNGGISKIVVLTSGTSTEINSEGEMIVRATVYSNGGFLIQPWTVLIDRPGLSHWIQQGGDYSETNQVNEDVKRETHSALWEASDGFMGDYPSRNMGALQVGFYRRTGLHRPRIQVMLDGTNLKCERGHFIFLSVP